MENIRMNADSAKQIGAFPHKDIRKHANPGDFIVDCSNGHPVLLPTDLIEFDKYCDGYAARGTYYKVVKPTDKIYETILDEAATYTRLTEVRDEVRALEEQSRIQRGRIQKELTSNTSSVLVLFFNRDKDYDMDGSEVEVRDGDKLLNFGRRFNNQGSLWIALVEVQGLITDSVEKWYKKDVWDRSSKKANYTQVMRDTGYRPGDKFVESCDLVKI